MTQTAVLARRLSVAFELQKQVAIFFALLLINEFVGPRDVAAAIGLVDHRILAYKLRRALKNKRPEVQVGSRRSVGYWIGADLRHNLLTEFDDATSNLRRLGSGKVAEQPPPAIRL